MAQTLQWLDPDRRRRRLRLLAELAGAKAERTGRQGRPGFGRFGPAAVVGWREHDKPHRAPVDQIRELIASRRRAGRSV